MKVPVSCNKDCGAGCPLVAEIKDNRVIRIADNPRKGRWMSGCARGYNAHRLTNHPERLVSPLLLNRRTDRLEKASWDAALDYTAEKLLQLRKLYGASTVIRLGGSGSCRGALHNTSTLTQRFLKLFGGYTETTASYSSAATSFVTPYVFGTSNAAIDAGSLMQTSFVLLLGANIADLRFGCELFNRLKFLRNQGVKMIVVDPRKSRTVDALNAEWIPIRPGTDSAFIAGVIYDLCENGGTDSAFISEYCHGFSEYKEWLYEHPVKSPKWASIVCGTSEASVREVADCYRRYKPAALIPGLSIQRTLGGEDSARSAMVLQAVTGNTGIKGGSSGANIWGPMTKVRCGKISSVPKGSNADMRYVPVYCWPDAVLTGLEDGPPVKAAYNCGGNYMLQGADSKKSAKALTSLDFFVTHDMFLTPTAELADVVLPAADFLERNDIVFPEGNFLLYSAKAVEPPPGVKTDYEIYSLLAERLGFRDSFTEGRDEAAWLDHFLRNSEVDKPNEFKKRGIWFGADDSRVAIADFIADPDGSPLNTPSGRIEISSGEYSKLGGSPFPVYTGYRPPDKIQLITPHQRKRINSQFIIMEKNQPLLLMNSTDALARGIADGDTVEVKSKDGCLTIGVELSEDIIPGTACLDCSYSNILTSTEPTMPSGGSRTHSTFVDIERC